MNLLKRKIAVLLLIFLIFTKSYALETDTHKIINKYVAGSSLNGFSLNTYLITDLGIAHGINKVFLGKKIFQCIADGGLYEDKPPIGPPYLRSFNHFHDPIYDKGYKGLWKASIIWGQLPKATQSPGGWYSWHDARWYFYQALTCQYENKRNEYWAKTFRALGQLMHLVQDASVPAHVRDDGHPFGFHYEKWVGVNQNKLNLTPEPFDKSIVKLNPSPLAPVPISNIIDTNQYSLSNLNYAQTWVSKTGISEFTNANFMSEDTIFQDYPHPTKENTNESLIEQTAKDGKKDRTWYIKGYTSEKLAAYSYLNRWLLPDKWTYNLDRYVYQDYASQLIPRAVGYSTGLLNYFFRGDINMVPNDSGAGFVIENNSDEEMSGTFELWYDDAQGNRKKAWIGELSIGKKSKSTSVSSALPKADKYILVFQGKMGNEDGAVVGKIIEKKRYLFLINLDQKVLSFEIKTKNNQYELIPLTKDINFTTGPTSSQLIVQSHPDQNEHVVIKPYSAIMYKPQIRGFGVRSAIGTQYVYRPQSFNENSPYRLYTTAFYPVKIYSYSDLEAAGRKSYALSDDRNQMVSYGNSIWKKNHEPMTCSGNHQEEGRTCNEKVAHYIKYVDNTYHLIDGLTLGIDEFFTYEYYGIDSDKVIKEETEHDVVATISNDKAVYKKNKSYWEWNRNYDGYMVDETTHCCKVSIINSSDEISNEVNLVLGDTSILKKTGEGFSEQVDTYWRYYNVIYPHDKKRNKHYVSKNTQFYLDIMDYDNLYNDKNIMLFYKITEQNDSQDINETWEESIGESKSSYKETTLTTAFHLYYKSNSITNSINLPFGETYHSENQDGTITETRNGTRITGVSSQINDKNIVYTYVAEELNENTGEWFFKKRIIGIINRADPLLAVGYRQEFEINESNASDILTDIYADYDYRDLAAIGVHVE